MLVKLLLLRLRGGIRQRLLELKSLRGLLLVLVMAGIAMLLLRQSELPETPLGDVFAKEPQQLRAQMAQFMPLSLLFAFLLTVFISAPPAIYFSPTEISLLFSAPFTRRALILYKLCCYALGVLLNSLLITVLTPSMVASPGAIFAGSFLALLFIQLLTVASNLLTQSLKDLFRRQMPWRYLPIALLMLLIAVGWCYVDVADGLKPALIRFQESLGGTLLLAPFGIFADIFLTQSPFFECWPSLLLAAAMNAVLIVVVIFLDGKSSEASTAASLERHQHWEQTRRSGRFLTENPVVTRTVMPPPKLTGIGPVIWRQWLSAFRSSRKVLWGFLTIAVLGGPLLVVASREISIWTLIGSIFFAIVFVLPKTLAFDFRNDLETMETFKSLPLPPWKINTGQMATPVLLSCLLELVLLASTAIFAGSHLGLILLAIAPFILPFNILLYGLENLFFLLFPAALVPVGRADFDFLGRTMLEFIVKSIILIASCVLSATLGWLVMKNLHLSWHVFIAVAWFALTSVSLLTLPLLNWAFRRFDVSRC